jgi:hypothetical protein
MGMLKAHYKSAFPLLLVSIFGVLESHPAWAAESAPTPILVELFTAEGCSDCPPADAFLRLLDNKQPVPGAQLIVLEEHVDYWDDQGWKDPFSSHALTLRQDNYVDRMRLQSPYTPQMVIDGAYQFVGSDRASATKALESARSSPKIDVRITSPKLENNKTMLHVDTDVLPVKADVLVAVAADHGESQVLRGENGGRHLEHVAIAKSIDKVGKAEKGQAFSKDVSISVKGLTQVSRVIVFLQEPNQGKILGATVELFKN